jgi:hypothetical protein
MGGERPYKEEEGGKRFLDGEEGRARRGGRVGGERGGEGGEQWGKRDRKGDGP